MRFAFLLLLSLCSPLHRHWANRCVQLSGYHLLGKGSCCCSAPWLPVASAPGSQHTLQAQQDHAPPSTPYPGNLSYILAPKHSQGGGGFPWVSTMCPFFSLTLLGPPVFPLACCVSCSHAYTHITAATQSPNTSLQHLPQHFVARRKHKMFLASSLFSISSPSPASQLSPPH